MIAGSDQCGALIRAITTIPASSRDRAGSEKRKGRPARGGPFLNRLDCASFLLQQRFPEPFPRWAVTIELSARLGKAVPYFGKWRRKEAADRAGLAWAGQDVAVDLYEQACAADKARLRAGIGKDAALLDAIFLAIDLREARERRELLGP